MSRVVTSFPTDRPVCFIATRAELLAALPGWRTPLPVAVVRSSNNPFNGAPITVRTIDPGPDVPVEVPATLPFEHVLLPNEEDWESRYVALALALAGEDGPAPSFYDDSDALIDAMATRGLDRPALVGGDASSDPRRVVTVPPSLVARLNALDATTLTGTLDTWNSRSPSASTLEDLRDLWSIARSAAAQQREMFVWLDAPPHRCSVHRPHRGPT